VVPWLLGSRYGEIDPQLRKTLEVALHAGAAIGIVIGIRRELLDDLRGLDAGQLLVIAWGSAPAGAAGLALERAIESDLGTPSTIAAGLLAGSLAMALADQAPEERSAEAANLHDGLWLGLAQAVALVPGISRTGATLAAARRRHFTRPAANILSRRLAFPVIIGASFLKAWRLRQSDLRGYGSLLLAGAVASFLSALTATRLRRHASSGPLLPYALYRTALAALILLRERRGPTAVREHGSAQDPGDAESV
jgi:undecaprenyl-diphosphatase